MKIKRHFAAVSHRDIIGQIRVHRPDNGVAWNFLFRPEIAEKLVGMNAGVRPAASVNRMMAAEYFGYGIFNKSLHRDGVGLNLPTVISTAVEAQPQT